MAIVGTIRSLHRYPVKSMAGESLQVADLLANGIANDRLYAFESAAAPPGMLRVSGVQRRELLGYRAWLDESKRVQVQTPQGMTGLVEDPLLLGPEFTLTHDLAPQTDVRPLALLSVQTVEQLTQELGQTLVAERFRANILLDMHGGGFAEDELSGRTLRLGAVATVLVRERTPRCRFITYDPAEPLTAEPAFALMRLLDQRHQGRAGVYASVLLPGRLQVGDAVEILF